jgi:biopolymer transport protein ExbB/TolQ
MTPEAAKALADAGPWAVVLFIMGVLGLAAARAFQVLWRDHLRADERDREQRDRAQAQNDATKDLLRQSLQNNAQAIEAWNKRNELEAARRRRGDTR